MFDEKLEFTDALHYHCPMFWRKLFQTLRFLAYSAVFVVIIAPEWPAFGAATYRLHSVVGLRQFDFFLWQLEAAWAKGEAVLTDGYTYLGAETRKQVVLDYLAVVQEIQQINGEMNRIFVDSAEPDPQTATQPLQTQLAQKRQELARLQPLAEAILQDQVSTVLHEQGIELIGRAWPPVMMYMTPVPSLLVVSPRDHIESVQQISLVHGLPVSEQEQMETAVFRNLNLSALVVPIGGMATYPAMIMETSSINWLAEVTAHEWTHHYLDLHPLGLNYGDPQVRVINETVASIIGKEIGALVIERFYPEFVPPPPSPPAPTTETAESTPAAPPPFDFRAEMAETRRTADELLAEGKIEAAEFYMEARRRYFVSQGYTIRKLNQAYFAFYGAYADEPGATGEDPIGPLVIDIRQQSGSLAQFLLVMAQVGSFADLQTAAGH